MTVAQIYNLVNLATREVLGESAVVQEDLSNIVDIGTEILNASAVDNYVRSLVNHIGRVIFVNRPYSGGAPSVLMDGWEYGSILEKITAELPVAVENDTWDLQDGVSYDPNVFHQPKVSAKFFNKRVTFEIDMSFTERQVKESFSNVAQLNGFLSMLYNTVEKSLTVKTDALIMRTINNMIANTVKPNGAVNNSPRFVNLVDEYNKFNSEQITAPTTGEEMAALLTNSAFMKFSALTIWKTLDRMGRISTLFNEGGKDRFTPRDMAKLIMLSDFRRAADFYVQADTFHDMFTALPGAETVPYWQGSGVDYDFVSVSTVNTGPTGTGGGIIRKISGVVAVLFDRDALGVCNVDRRVTSNYNPKGEFYTNFYKFDAGYFNDFNENFVVFGLTDKTF